MTFFSIIIPTYNRERFIREAVDSALNQTFRDFEIIIVDDGSTDNTELVLKERYEGSDIVKYFKKLNEERGAARNYGINKASGKFLIFLDSDDTMEPDYLQTLKGIITEFPDIKFFAAKHDYVDENGVIQSSALQNLKEGWYDFNFFLTGTYIASNFCIKNTRNELFFFPEERELSSMEDWIFVLGNVRNSRLYLKDKVCVKMREHAGQSMKDNQGVIKAKLNAMNWIQARMSLTNKQIHILKSNAYYFCGVHYYIDGNNRMALKMSIRSLKYGGVSSRIILLLFKSLVGRKIIQMVVNKLK